MTCFVGDKWEITPFHVWAGLAWIVGAALMVPAVLLASERFAWSGIAVLAIAATYTICANVQASARTQREAFELGVEHERRRTAEAEVSRLGR